MARFVLAWLLLVPAPALAHNLHLFAQVRGAVIAGNAYFSPGDIAARQIDVIARDPSGRELGRTKTDDNGEFEIPAKVKVDYQLTAETPDHASIPVIVAAAELPDGLPGASTVRSPKPRDSGGNASTPAAEPKSDSHPVSVEIDALRTQVELLRRQVDLSEQQLRFRDILGGIGYILGLAGIGLYFKTQHKKAV